MLPSTSVIENVIVFHDGSREFITKKQADQLVQQSSGGLKGATFNGNYIAFSAIAKILTAQKYYEQYPDEAPPVRNEYEMSREECVPVARTIEQRKEMLNGALKGLQQYIAERPVGEARPAMSMLMRWEEKLRCLRE